MTYQLYLGDCLEIMKSFSNESIESVFTDVPYGDINHIERLHERGKYKGQIRNFNKSDSDLVTFDWNDMLSEVFRVTRKWIYMFAGNHTGYVRSYFNERDCLTRMGVWEKMNPTPIQGQYIWLSSIELCAIVRKRKAPFNRFCQSPVWKHGSGSSKIHPSEKPLSLMVELIESSTKQGDLVLDPFMGSGSTGEACLKTGRRFIGIEKNPKYFARAKRRLEFVEGNLLGKFVYKEQEEESKNNNYWLF